jgi:hypothetical protein
LEDWSKSEKTINEAERIYSKIKAIIKQGEGLTVEFKKCKTALNKNVYETVCAFSNRYGGHLILGVKDNGMITGISKEHCPKIITDFVTSLNNPQKINPPLYLSPVRHYALSAWRYEAHSVHVQRDLASARFIARVHERELKVFVYTVNSSQEIGRLQALGVDGIFADFPKLVIKR